MKAVINVGDKQYLVSEGQQIIVDRLADSKKEVSITDVLLVIDDKKTHVGQPFLKDASVKAEFIGQVLGEKIRVEKYKAKSKYHKVRGYRSKQSKLLIKQISVK